MADRTTDVPPIDPALIPGFGDDRRPVVIFCVVFCLSVATAMVALRVWTRTMIIKKMGPDDWAAIATLVCETGFSNDLVLTRLCPDYHMGRGHNHCSLFVALSAAPLYVSHAKRSEQQPSTASASIFGPLTLQP